MAKDIAYAQGEIAFPEGVEEIVAVAAVKLRKRIRKNDNNQQELERAAREIVETIQNRVVRNDLAGFQRNFADESAHTLIWQDKNRAAFDWAARQYFKQLVVDKARLDKNRDHGLCDPEP